MTGSLFALKPVTARVLAAVCVLAAIGTAHAAERMELPVVKPAIACSDLARAGRGHAASTPVTLGSAAQTDTPKGSFCKVQGSIAPAIASRLICRSSTGLSATCRGDVAAFAA